MPTLTALAYAEPPRRRLGDLPPIELRWLLTQASQLTDISTLLYLKGAVSDERRDQLLRARDVARVAWAELLDLLEPTVDEVTDIGRVPDPFDDPNGCSLPPQLRARLIMASARSSLISDYLTPTLSASEVTTEVGRLLRFGAQDATRALCGIVRPPSWERVKRVAEQVRTERGAIGDVELAAAVRAHVQRWAYARTPSTLPSARRRELADSDLRKQGMTGALHNAEVILAAVVRTVEDDVASAVSLGQLLEMPTDRVLDLSGGQVTLAAVASTRHRDAMVGSLACEIVFGPRQDHTCTCGKYTNWPRAIVCERCGVATLEASARQRRIGHLVLPAAVRAPDGRDLTVVPVVPAGLREVVAVRDRYQVPPIAAAYSALLQASSAAATLVPLGGVVGHDAYALLQDTFDHLVSLRAAR